MSVESKNGRQKQDSEINRMINGRHKKVAKLQEIEVGEDVKGLSHIFKLKVKMRKNRN